MRLIALRDIIRFKLLCIGWHTPYIVKHLLDVRFTGRLNFFDKFWKKDLYQKYSIYSPNLKKTLLSFESVNATPEARRWQICEKENAADDLIDRADRMLFKKSVFPILSSWALSLNIYLCSRLATSSCVSLQVLPFFSPFLNISCRTCKSLNVFVSKKSSIPRRRTTSHAAYICPTRNYSWHCVHNIFKCKRSELERCCCECT